MRSALKRPAHLALRAKVWHRACVVALVLLLGSAAGCEVFSWIAQGIAPGKVRAVYTLDAEMPTLVMVDDPDRKLGSRALAAMAATEAGYQLENEEAVQAVIPAQSLVPLMTRLGAEYAKTPIDRIGRELGADQVVHVFVERVVVTPEPTIVRPKAVVRVKVIDAAAGKRLFPSTDQITLSEGGEPVSPGYPLVVELFYRQRADRRGDEAAVRQELARRIGRDVARLFHDYPELEPWQRFEE